MYWKQKNKGSHCTKNQREFHHIFTNIVGNISLLKLSVSLILSEPHYWRNHILIKILTAPNSSRQYLHPIHVKEMHFNALLNGDGLLILGHFCKQSASTKSIEISWQFITVFKRQSEVWEGHPPTAALLEMSPHTVTLRATRCFVPHVLLSLDVIQMSNHYTTSLPHATFLWLPDSWSRNKWTDGLSVAFRGGDSL